MSSSDLEDCVIYLECDKVSERKKYCSKLSTLLDNKSLIISLRNGRNTSWKRIIQSLQTCMKKDADKAAEDARKKLGVGTSPTVSKSLAPELLIQVVNMAIKEDEQIKISELVGYIIGCMNDTRMKKYYSREFLTILQKSILSKPLCIGNLRREDWTDLYEMLKILLEENSDNSVVSNCFMLLIKWGPTSGLSPIILREEFDFMTKYCQKIIQGSLRFLKDDTLEIATNFCEHNAKDNRVSCCKFGEDTIYVFTNLYEENGKPERTKELLVQFFLLQMIMHHPNGVSEGHPSAFAHSWKQWKRLIKTMYNLLNKEISLYFKYTQKNSSFFKDVGGKFTVCENFSRLFVEMSRQIFLCPDVDVSVATEQISPPLKRPRTELTLYNTELTLHNTELTLRTYIDYIQDTQSWLWIHFVSSIIKTYPDLVNIEDYIALLQSLSSIQIQNNEYNVIEGIYFCFTIMLRVEQSLDISSHQDQIKELWKFIGASTTRAFALNQHKDATEKLLQELMARGIIDFEEILPTYHSGVIPLSLQSVKTFNSGLRFMILNDLQKKERIMKSILQNQNLKDHQYLCCKETARFLIKLTFKQFSPDQFDDDYENLNDYHCIKECHLKTLLDENTLVPKPVTNTETNVNVANVDFDAAILLTRIVKDFVMTGEETTEIILSKMILLCHISSYMLECNLITEEQSNTSRFIEYLQVLLKQDAVKNFSLNLNQIDSERDVKRLTGCLEMLHTLFSLKVCKWVMEKLKELVPVSLLTTLFAAFNNMQNNQQLDKRINLSAYFSFKISLIQTLSSYCCVCGSTLNAMQKNILEPLSSPDYNYCMDDDYNLVTTFLKTAKFLPQGIVSHTVLDDILNCIQDLCVARYHDKGEDILNILSGLFPVLISSGNSNLRETSVCLLKPFYDNLSNYGPNVSISLLNCFQILCKLDPQNQFAQWSGVEIIKFVPEFLKSDYQEVRFKAIDVLATFFETNSKSTIMKDIHRQEEICSKIFEASKALFEVSGRMSEERRVDEVITRTASVLLTFINIITSSENWIKDGIYLLIKLAHIRNIDELNKAFNVINKRKFGQANLNILEIYLIFLIEKWLNDGFNFADFPFRLLNCSDKYEFYQKYFDECAYFLIMTEQDEVATVARKLEIDDKRIVERTAAQIFSRTICSDPSQMTSDVLTKNKILVCYSQTVGLVALNEILKENLHHVVVGILDFLTDDTYIESVLGESVIFFDKHLSVQEVNDLFKFVESFLCDGQPLGLILTQHNLRKFENIMLQLKSNIYKSTVVKDQLNYFHKYTYFTNIITPYLTTESPWRYFFIRDVIHTLLNIIENNESCPSMISASCKFLELLLKTILPALTETFKDFFHDTVNALRKFYVTSKTIASNCRNMLNFLIVANLNEFADEIKNLDTFPNITDFKEIRTVQKNVRYGDREPGVEDEINQFLNNKDMLTKEDSLIHLREMLASQKNKLLIMYDRLQEMRKFSEDCEDSVLHRLVCTLSQLSYSSNQKVSFEAARCLGELGPSNLQTLVLQPKKVHIHAKHPLEILLGCAMSFLTKYLIDCDINVIKNASGLFYIILDSQEGKKIVETQSEFGCGPIIKNYIIPYFPLKSSKSVQCAIVNYDLFETILGQETLWCPNTNMSHNSWITALVSALLKCFSDTSILHNFTEMCKLKVDFTESLFPLVIDLLISKGKSNNCSLLIQKVDHFFSQHWELTVRQTSHNGSIALNKRSVKAMLNAVNYIRLTNKCGNRSRVPIKLSFNYLQIAKAAEFCADHFSALYYSELWCQEVIERIQIENVEYCGKRSTMIDFIYESENKENGETLHNLLKNAYKSIGDFDALPGCGISFLLQPKYRVEHYKDLGKFDQVIQFYANETSIQGTSSRDLIDSFKNYGVYQIPMICSQPDDPEYECLWRLAQWTFEEKKRPISSGIVNYEDFEKYRFSSLKALHNNNQCAFEESSTFQFLCVINHLKNISFESSYSLYPILTKLASVVDMEDFYKNSQSGSFESLFQKWRLQDTLIFKNDFQYVEPIIAQRLVMLTDYLKKGSHDNVVRNYIIDLSLDFAGWAKEEGHIQEGSAILERLKRISGLDNDTITKIDLLDAQLSWSVNNTLVSRQILNRLCKDLDINPKLRSVALKLTGQYLGETHTENRTTIITNYFLTSIQLMGPGNRNGNDVNNIMDTYDKLALFADKEYQQIMAYMKSDLFQKKIANMEQSRKTATNIQNQRKRTHDEQRAAVMYNKNSCIDYNEINSTKQERNQFLKIALKYYLLCLLYSDDKNIRIFRIVALFLENRKNEEVAGTIEDYLTKLPSYKFIMTLPQLIPHLSENNTDLFSSKVNKIIEQCALDHPHHTLPLLLSLANAYNDREFDESQTKTTTNDARVSTAKDLIKKLKQKGLGDFIKKMEDVSLALIHLAYYKSPDDRKDRREFNIPRSQKIMSIKNFEDILVPTCELAVSAKKKYLNIIGISSFKSTYQIVGGINEPKKIYCRGTDGNYYSQLVKGQDDLRQDAVMQQVFNIMNNLLSYNKSTKHLMIRTYKIVPLSMRSGILKWADNSMPIGEYLTGSKDCKGAHQTYRPNDKLPSACKDAYKRSVGKSPEQKLKIYTDICKQFKPVLHYFFEYYFPQPAVWYQRRRAYIHSVATTSMCGYILGIGDRHTSNILIDKTTAEVIHIDFGIAFEQGRVLPTPETVPFRLTRDIVDGMGVSGVEGLFRRSCEKTMEVLRQNAQTITTILEVLLYDPLYAWTVTSAEAKKRQTDSDNSITSEATYSSEESPNVSAERALLRLREKLQGTELGHPRSIEHQVGTLIQQAVDPENLSKLYVGWQPFV